MYGLEDPSSCLNKDPPSKSSFKENILIKITAFHERELKVAAVNNSRMSYLNVSLCNLRGRVHPAISDLYTYEEVRQSQYHIKMLTGDFFTYKMKAELSGGSPHCRLCSSPHQNFEGESGQYYSESISHILITCCELEDKRRKIISEITKLCSNIEYLDIHLITQNEETLTQFILDPSSLNLQSRVNISDPILPEIIKKSRNLCYAISQRRMELLKLKDSNQK